MSRRTRRIPGPTLLAFAVFLVRAAPEAQAVTVTFDAGAGRPASYTEAGISVVPADNPEDHVHLGDNDDNGSPDLMLHPLCCSTPYQFTFSGGLFTLATLDFVLRGGTHTFTSSSGATISPTADGTVTFPAEGWQGITLFTWRDDGVSILEQGIIDDLRFCPGDCDDANVCTTDRCDPDDPGADANGCTHVPNDNPCDDGVFCNGSDLCTRGSCGIHAGDPCTAGPECADTCNEAAGNCFAPAGMPCTDDGNVCTDDRCNAVGACRHLSEADATAAEFAAQPARAEGEECREDGDACTEDVCRAGDCAHERLVEASDCTLAQDAFRLALSLGVQLDGLLALVDEHGPQELPSRLTQIRDDLTAAARALGGKAQSAPLFLETPLRQRARLALVAIQHARPRMAAFLSTLSRPAVRAGFAPEVADEIERRARLVNQGLKALKAEVKRLRRLVGTFARSRRGSAASR